MSKLKKTIKIGYADVKIRLLDKKELDIEEKLIRLFKTPFTPTKYREQDDYYTYINYQWLEDKKKELAKEAKYFVQVDSFILSLQVTYKVQPYNKCKPEYQFGLTSIFSNKLLNSFNVQCHIVV